MSVSKDCGDMKVSVVIRTGVSYPMPATEDDEKLRRIRIDEKIAELLPALEKTLLDQVCDHIGYDQKTVDAQVKERDDKIEADRIAEKEGRAAKHAQRQGLPPPTKAQEGESVKPGETPHEVQAAADKDEEPES